MGRKKKTAWQPPQIDGKMQPGNTYICFLSKYTDKAEAARIFKVRYGADPEQVFYGKPGGWHVYAGAIPNQFTH